MRHNSIRKNMVSKTILLLLLSFHIMNSFIFLFFRISFIDNDFYNCFYDTPFTPGININECFQNGKFLTDLLNILIDTRNGDE